MGAHGLSCPLPNRSFVFFFKVYLCNMSMFLGSDETTTAWLTTL